MNRITVAEMLDKADTDKRERLVAMLAKADNNAGIVLYENQDMSSSQLGARSFLVFGGPYSLPTHEAVVERYPWLNDLPSQRQYPVAYCVKGDA